MRASWWKILLILGCYLWGSLNLAFFAGKAMKGKDLRRIGSGNLGTENVYKNVSKSAGALVFFGDCLKGAAPILITRAAGVSLAIQAGCALAVMAGHNWPFYLHFRGGRGLAVALTSTLILNPWGGLGLVAMLGVGALTSGHGAELALVGLVLQPILAWGLHMPTSIIVFSLGTLLFTLLRRAQGSPQVARPQPRPAWHVTLRCRIHHDREVCE